MFGMGTSVTSWVKSPEKGRGANPTCLERSGRAAFPCQGMKMAGQECTSLLTNS